MVAIGETHRSLRQEVIAAIRERIIAGRYPQASRLPEEELAAEFGVSRNPVREALQALALDGFVELEPRRGARVSLLTVERATDLFDVRQALEGLVASLAATRRSEAQLAAMRAIIDTADRATASGDLEPLPELNTRFHQMLAEAAGNELLADTLHRLAHVIQWVYTSRITLRSERSWSEHRRIVDAIAAGDRAAAEREARAHIANARDAFLQDAHR